MWKCALLLFPLPHCVHIPYTWVPFKLWVLNGFSSSEFQMLFQNKHGQVCHSSTPWNWYQLSLLFTFFCCDKPKAACGRRDLFHHEGKSGQESQVPGGRSWSRDRGRMLSMACSVWFLYNPGSPAQAWYTRSGLGTSTSITKCPYRLAYRPSWWRHLLNLDSLFSGTPVCIRLIKPISTYCFSFYDGQFWQAV